MKNIKVFQTKQALLANIKTRASFEDEDDRPSRPTHLPYFKKTQSCDLIEVSIDEEIKGPEYYRLISQAIRDSSEHDLIRFYINSPGGRLDGLMTVITSMWKTDATIEAHIDGFCDSSASMLAMHCDNVFVSPLASMLVHNASFGIGGKSPDIKAHVDHFTNFFDKFFRETYEHFLTPDEIEKCLNGYQLYLDAENIAIRLEAKYKKLAELQSNHAIDESEPEEPDETAVVQLPDTTKRKSKNK